MANNTNQPAKRGGIKSFFKGVWSELKKVHWSNKKELIKYTGVVIVTVAGFAVVISAFDWIISSIVELLLGLA